MGDTVTLFRLLAASALVGLLAYCSSYVVQIWRKRNAKPADQARRSTTRRKIAWFCLFMGLVLTPSAGMLREFTRSEATLTGEDLFVVRANEGMAVEWIQDRDAVAAGEPLVRFGSGSRSSKADELRARLARAEAEKTVLELSPLTPDPELTRRHQAAAQERAQVQQELGSAIAAAEASDRDTGTQLQSKKEAVARLDRTLTEKRKDLERAIIRCQHNRSLLESYTELRVRGTITNLEYKEQQKAVKDAEIEVSSLTQELKDGKTEKDLLQAHLEKLESGRTSMVAPLPAQIAGLRTRLAKLEADEADLRARLDKDLARSTKLREAEVVQADAKVQEQKSGLGALTGEQEIKAPFAGRIAWRAQSPNAIRQQGALMVLGPDNGFLLTARLPKSDVDALRDGGEVMLELGDDSPERRIPARFRKAATLAHETEYSSLQLECQPPPEVVRRLADGEKLTVNFAWHPPLAGMWPFRVGILLMLVGIAALFLTRQQPEAPSEALVRMDQPLVQRASRFGDHFRERIRQGQINPDLYAPLENGGRSRKAAELSEVGNEIDAPDFLDELEDLYRDSLDRLHRAECPKEASRLLEQLQQLRAMIRALDVSNTPPLKPQRNGDGHSVIGAGS
jgi:HlyD family secretion protein